MDISNPDLTKKVLRALSPNDIKSENEFDKQRSIVDKMYPSFGKRADEDRKKALKQGIGSVEKGLEERGVDVSKLPKSGLFDRFRRKQGKATIKSDKPKRGMFDMFKKTQKAAPINTRTPTQQLLKVDPKNLEKFKRKKSRKIPSPIQAPGVKPTTKRPFGKKFTNPFTKKKRSITREVEVV